TLAERCVSRVDSVGALGRRRGYYLLLHRSLANHNLFHATLPADATPFCYPLLLDRPVDRRLLACHRLYVPTLWEEVPRRRGTGFDWERKFATQLLPLPIDHCDEPEHMVDALHRRQNVVNL